MFSEEDFLPLSGLQHLLFCERQWALIHLEQQWDENRLTAEGRLLHARVDELSVEQREGVRTVRALPLRSFRLGLSGRADVVEFPHDKSSPCPVEYKRGRNKITDVDRVQLCAQAICLEEMLDVNITEAHLFYHQTRRRIRIALDPELRKKTELLAIRMHNLYSSGQTPAPVFLPHCKNCSLINLCQPSALVERGKATTFFRRSIYRQLEVDE